ncbi:MAG: HEAT repeat domain-containing protein [Bacteroidota bacterium]|nr:HEAT repeat domain-containing protein [Bacteroidota bacterium]MDP4189936.1 HEAT repeat domain-containing protein [Bacteroidota bacterium]MDP4194507.1 HEAT repeat domain-containing protein [Bacteroidota bacterium]
MKTNTTKRMRALMALVAMLVAISAMSVMAQANVDEITGSVKVELKKNAVENLLVNISSDIDGVRKSAIYFAGYYKVDQAKDALMKQFTKEKDPATRILIALSLYKLGDEDGMNLVKKYSQKDPDSRVKRMCSAIYTDYLMNLGKVASK